MLISFKRPVSYSSGLKLPLISNPINICVSLNYFIVLISIYSFIIPRYSVAIYEKEKQEKKKKKSLTLAQELVDEM